jgi:hypothetical protein
MADRLTAEERKAKDRFVRAVEALMLHMTAEEVGHIADYVSEYGTDGDGGTREDAVILGCLLLIVDEVSQ